MPEVVYSLCAVTAIVCAILLWRGYTRSRSRLLLWSTLCFVMLAINNILLFIDLAVVKETYDLSPWRNITAFLAGALIVFGLIWDAE